MAKVESSGKIHQHLYLSAGLVERLKQEAKLMGRSLSIHVEMILDERRQLKKK